MSLTCDELDSLLPEFMDGQLPEAKLDAALDHIASCDSCRIVVSDLKGVGELYREHGRMQLPPEARRRILDSLGDAT